MPPIAAEPDSMPVSRACRGRRGLASPTQSITVTEIRRRDAGFEDEDQGDQEERIGKAMIPSITPTRPSRTSDSVAGADADQRFRSKTADERARATRWR